MMSVVANCHGGLVGVALLIASGCTAGTASGSDATDQQRPAVSGPVARADAVARLERGVEALVEAPLLRVDGFADEDGIVRQFLIEIDRVDGVVIEREYLLSVEHSDHHDSGSEIAQCDERSEPLGPAEVAFERERTGGSVRARQTLPEESEWSVMGDPTDLPAHMADTLSLFGRASGAPTLLAALLGEGVGEVRALTSGDADGMSVSVGADELATFLSTSGAEALVSEPPAGTAVWEIWFDPQGAFARVRACGVQFFDGEPFADSFVQIDYDLTGGSR